MKTVQKILAGACLCAALAFMAPDVQASGQLQQTAITNNLQGGASAQVLISYPTNTFNPTNGFPQGTGHGVQIGNQEHFGINLQGFLLNTGVASHITFSFVSSMASGPPQVLIGTNLASVNQTVLLQSDWSSTNNYWWVDIPIPATSTNWFNWQTNFIAPGIYPVVDANWIGVYAISNYLTAQNYLTNCSLGINTKLIPSPIIGN